MHKPKLVIVEDEEDIAGLVTMQGELEGYKVLHESDGLNGFILIQKEKPDIVILDIMLPGQSGLDLCRKMKNDPDLQHIPIILLSAKGEEVDIILGLELGADDYVPKPFSPKVLFSRVRAVLRRGKEAEKAPKAISFGAYQLDLESYYVKKGVKSISLTLSEFHLLKHLAMHPGKVLTRNQLLDAIQSSGGFVVDRNIDVHIASLRKKLGPNFDWIETVRGLGYRFKPIES